MTNQLQSQDDYRERIALWGPSGSGKSWIINSLDRSLEQRSEQSDDFEYKLWGYTNHL
jgi:GTPase SAR1 family protein